MADLAYRIEKAHVAIVGQAPWMDKVTLLQRSPGKVHFGRRHSVWIVLLMMLGGRDGGAGDLGDAPDKQVVPGSPGIRGRGRDGGRSGCWRGGRWEGREAAKRFKSVVLVVCQGWRRRWVMVRVGRRSRRQSGSKLKGVRMENTRTGTADTLRQSRLSHHTETTGVS